jgi:ubiquinone/menaquinone biosynthesis C-methylase UbiE
MVRSPRREGGSTPRHRMTTSSPRQRRMKYWDKHSASYDGQMLFLDRVLFKDSRTWVCSQAAGETLEVGVGTGLNFPFYPANVRLTGIDLSTAMIAIARNRPGHLDRQVELREADAHALPFADASFDTVVCTFSLCAIPDDRLAITEMYRVLRPGGLLLLADHVASSAWLVRGIQRLLEVISIRQGGEHFLRRPVELVRAQGFEITKVERFKLGIVERVAARRPDLGRPS